MPEIAAPSLAEQNFALRRELGELGQDVVNCSGDCDDGAGLDAACVLLDRAYATLISTRDASDIERLDEIRTAEHQGLGESNAYRRNYVAKLGLAVGDASRFCDSQADLIAARDLIRRAISTIDLGEDPPLPRGNCSALGLTDLDPRVAKLLNRYFAVVDVTIDDQMVLAPQPGVFYFQALRDLRALSLEIHGSSLLPDDYELTQSRSIDYVLPSRRDIPIPTRVLQIQFGMEGSNHKNFEEMRDFLAGNGFELASRPDAHLATNLYYLLRGTSPFNGREFRDATGSVLHEGYKVLDAAANTYRFRYGIGVMRDSQSYSSEKVYAIAVKEAIR